MKIVKITKAKLSRGVADRWAETYADTFWNKSGEKREIERQLKALKSPSPEKIAAIIGNDSWTSIDCEVCNKDQTEAVVLSGEYLAGVTVCEQCLRAALRKLSR